MPREYCSTCQAVRNVVVTVTEAEEPQPDGSVCKVKTESLHCESCGAFICNRTMESVPGRK